MDVPSMEQLFYTIYTSYRKQSNTWPPVHSHRQPQRATLLSLMEQTFMYVRW